MVSGRVTRVLVDANILYSRTLRDWLSLLYLRGGHGMFEVLWTEDVMAEVVYHKRKDNPFLSDKQVGGIRRKIEETFGDGALIRGYHVDETLVYRDPGDAHIHAAAVHAGADIVLTANDKDFNNLDELPYEIYTADDFFELVDDSRPELVQIAMREQLVYWVRRDGKSLPEALKSAGAPEFGERIRRYLQNVDVARLLKGKLP
ncbi:PIN domain-containing protein [Nocardia sp. NBC_00403]|uniref:PIN domain-containing protein n=1 Tax=Nocardia sp. NBC_00403 TaxID=2975990 RepID=UPI002E1AE91F